MRRSDSIFRKIADETMLCRPSGDIWARLSFHRIARAGDLAAFEHKLHALMAEVVAEVRHGLGDVA